MKEILDQVGVHLLQIASVCSQRHTIGRYLIPESCNYYVFNFCALRFFITDRMAVLVFHCNQPDKWAGGLLSQRRMGADMSGHPPEAEALGKDVSPSN